MSYRLRQDVQKMQTSVFVRLFEYVLAVAEQIGEETAWRILGDCAVERRKRWLETNQDKLSVTGTEVEKAYDVFLLKYLNLDPEEAPIVEKTEKKIVYRSHNFCPVLEACKALNLDTKRICKLVYEKPAQIFLSTLNPRLKFKRNYKKIRPYTDYCEEIIELRER